MKSSLLLPAALLLATAGTLLAAEPANLIDALTQGQALLNLRLRYEGVEQTGLRDADALTLRTRVGFATAPWRGWKALIEGENIAAADGDSYSQAGLNPGGAGCAVIADPESTEINRASLSYASGRTTVTAGRQRLVLDNARFVGDVGWRQNMQTFDAIVVSDESLDKTTLTYAFLDRINRVFSDRHAQGKWRSGSHLLNARYAGFAAGTLTGYAYLLDIKKTAAADSCATYGASFAGTARLSADVRLAYRAELATQSDYGSSTLNYSARYLGLEAGLAGKPGSLGLGYELLGSGNNTGFKTPLATLHAFNGWADLFLTTPAAGLRDTYGKAAAALPGKLALLAFYHRFQTEAGQTRLGSEFDAQLGRQFGPQVTALVKYASFRRAAGTTLPDVQKIWLQVEFIR